MPNKISEFLSTQWLISRLLALFVVLVLAFGGTLVYFAWGDLEQLKKVYELVVINTLAEPFVAIIAAYIVYVFGDKTLEYLKSRG